MNVWEALLTFLASPVGVLLGHAIIGFLNALTLSIVERNRRRQKTTEERLDRYVGQLMRQIHGGHSHD